MRAPTVLPRNDVIDMKRHKGHLCLLDTAVFAALARALPDQRAEGVIRHGAQAWCGL